MNKLVPTAAIVTALAACGGAQTFGLTSDDNNQAALGRALAMREVPAQPAPRNATGKPMLFAVMSGKQRKLVAYDLTAGKPVWTVDADVQSRVEVGDDFVVSREGNAIVARNLADGAPRWKHGISGELMGVSADAERAYVVVADTSGARPVWTLTALDAGSGNPSWSADSPGQLGAPAAQGGLVMSPFLKQWLSILDARTGEPITRIRGIDEEIGFVQTTSDAAWFGSRAGVFRLDAAASSGQRAQSSYGTAKLPKQLTKATWGADGFDTVQAGYSAADRTRILWRAATGGEGPLVFQDGVVAVHYFRFLFGYSQDGDLKWAYSHPRVGLVASAHVGPVLAAISQQGDVIAIEPATGKLRWQAALGADGQVLGATFDADGWAPQGEVDASGEAGGTVAALISIARDRDARFADIKELAVSALANLPGREVSAELLGMIQDARTPARLRETAVEVLVSRRDVTALDVYAAALSVRADYIANTRPVAVAEIARVIAGLAGPDLEKADAKARKEAVEALVLQLESPETTPLELLEIVRALSAIGDGAELPPLRRQLLAYRADPAFGGDGKLVKAVVDALLARGGAEDRETVAFVADDPRTHEAVAAYAHKALQAE
jgi:outer membrane protein assembly factor BamB